MCERRGEQTIKENEWPTCVSIFTMDTRHAFCVYNLHFTAPQPVLQHILEIALLGELGHCIQTVVWRRIPSIKV